MSEIAAPRASDTWRKFEAPCTRCGVVVVKFRASHKYCGTCKFDAMREQNAAMMQARRLADPEKAREISRNNYHANLEAGRQRCRDYLNRNREQINARKREYYRANREAQIRKTAAWQKANPQAKKEHDRRRKARKKNADGWYAIRDFKRLCNMHGWRCFYCNVGLNEKTVTCDHAIPLARGGTNFIGNLLPACLSCNTSKGSKTLMEFRMYREQYRGV